MKFDENHVFIKFHQISSKFNFYFQNLVFFDEPVKKTNKLIELDRIGLALIFLKHVFQFMNLFKTKTNSFNIFQCFFVHNKTVRQHFTVKPVLDYIETILDFFFKNALYNLRPIPDTICVWLLK